ncbi:MAG: guanylate kinase [Clostridia bacterium]|nr:guanylate kinase [Clostridia bacterium]
MQTVQKGMLIIVSGPSGVGKGTLVSRLLEEDKTCCFSVSCTTRNPREGEIPDVHYHYISREEFDRRVQLDAFLEHATVHGNSYGTLKSEVEAMIQDGKNVVLDIDPQGARMVKGQRPDAVSIFILPPSFTELRKRLEGRHTETPEEVERRFHNARGEIAQMHLYDYLIINDQLDEAYELLRSIVEAEKHRSAHYCPVIPE